MVTPEIHCHFLRLRGNNYINPSTVHADVIAEQKYACPLLYTESRKLPFLEVGPQKLAKAWDSAIGRHLV